MIDIGANLTNKRFENDIDQVLANALQADVENIIITGTDIFNSTQALQLCNRYPFLYSTAGVHPHAASAFDKHSLTCLRYLLDQPQVVAVGETGLDFNRNFSTKEQQIYAFEQQLELAIETNMPVFLHEREAFETQYRILEPLTKHLKDAVVHCFTGNQHALEAYLQLGFYIGITGWICDERRGQELQSIIDIIPNNRLLIETDSPYLTPRTLTGKKKKAKNQPANLSHIAQKIGDIRGQTLSEICKMTTDNSRRLFGF